MARYLPVLFLLACPVMMIFMMRGMGGHKSAQGHDAEQEPGATSANRDERDARIAELEREVADLRNHPSGSVAPDPRTAER